MRLLSALSSQQLHTTRHIFNRLLFLAYFPIWWSGAEIGRAIKRHEPIPFGKIFAALGLLMSAFAIYVFIWLANGGAISVGTHPVIELRNSGAASSLVFVFYLYQRSSLDFSALIRPFAVVAPISLHFPIVTNGWMLSLPVAIRIPSELIFIFLIAWPAEKTCRHLALRLRSQVIAWTR